MVIVNHFSMYKYVHFNLKSCFKKEEKRKKVHEHVNYPHI